MAKAARAARKPFVYEETALERAQSVFYEACEARTTKGRIALAKKALAISPLCADAFVMLAEHTERGSDEALDLWRRGVDAGKEALGADFEEFAGEFLGLSGDAALYAGAVWHGPYGHAARATKPPTICAPCSR